MPETNGRAAIPEIAALLSHIDTCVFATVAGNGDVHTRPMSNNGDVEWDGTSWFFAPADGRLASEIRRDRRVAMTYRAEDRFAWISLTGEAELVDDVDRKRTLWQAMFERWFPNGPDDPGVGLIRVVATTAEWWTEAGDGRAELR
jgi:general stress protein 26